MYVQNLLEMNQEEICNLLFEKKASVYICGGTEMGRAVMKTLAKMIANYLKLNLIQSAQKIEELEKQKKIIKELWG